MIPIVGEKLYQHALRTLSPRRVRENDADPARAAAG
jgi:hypothetical protein